MKKLILAWIDSKQNFFWYTIFLFAIPVILFFFHQVEKQNAVSHLHSKAHLLLISLKPDCGMDNFNLSHADLHQRKEKTKIPFLVGCG